MSLRALAAYVGVLSEYTSHRGERVEVHDEVLAAVLTACGVDTTLPDDRAIADYDERTRTLPSIVIAWDGVVPADTSGRARSIPDIAIRISPHRRRARSSARRGAPAVTTQRSGVYVPTYALATSRRGDVGDLMALRQLFDWVHSHGADTVLTLPLLATFPDVASPYSPISRLFWNELHLAPHRDDAARGTTAESPARLIDYPTAFRGPTPRCVTKSR